MAALLPTCSRFWTWTAMRSSQLTRPKGHRIGRNRNLLADTWSGACWTSKSNDFQRPAETGDRTEDLEEAHLTRGRRFWERGESFMSSPDFESIKHLNPYNVEYWEARELQPLLGYKKWEQFEQVIKKAMVSCETTGRQYRRWSFSCWKENDRNGQGSQTTNHRLYALTPGLLPHRYER
jgi:hypothetical protein